MLLEYYPSAGHCLYNVELYLFIHLLAAFLETQPRLG